MAPQETHYGLLSPGLQGAIDTSARRTKKFWRSARRWRHEVTSSAVAHAPASQAAAPPRPSGIGGVQRIHGESTSTAASGSSAASRDRCLRNVPGDGPRRDLVLPKTAACGERIPRLPDY